MVKGDDMLKIGQILTIVPLDEEREKYRSKIIDLSDDAVYISYPADIQSNRTVYLLRNERFRFIFITSDGEVYEFVSEIIGHIKKSLPLLKISRPGDGDFQKVQRRRFVRVRRTLDVAIHPKNKEFTPFHTITTDISAGGASIIVPNSITLKENQQVIGWFVLPWENGEYDYVKIPCKVVRITPHNEDNWAVSFEFIDLPMKEEQLLIRFCFESQLILQKLKGITK